MLGTSEGRRRGVLSGGGGVQSDAGIRGELGENYVRVTCESCANYVHITCELREDYVRVTCELRASYVRISGEFGRIPSPGSNSGPAESSLWEARNRTRFGLQKCSDRGSNP